MTTAIKRRSKGEQTRLKILKAAIEVIASTGIKGTTHRAVAEKADTQLSLTTYYFKDIKQLVREALELNSNTFLSSYEKDWNNIFGLIDNLNAAQLRKVSVKEDVCNRLSKVAAEHFYFNIANRPAGLAVEQICFTEMNYQSEIKDIAIKHSESLIKPFVKLASYFNKVDPEVDAELTMIAITRLQYKYLSENEDTVDKDLILRLLKRQFGWLMGIKRH